jgi:2-dehydropantoate 2-reductase
VGNSFRGRIDLKVLVMGSGGVGGYYGAVLHRAGHDVTFVARGDHLDAIQKNGLQVESVGSGNFTIHPTVTNKPDLSHASDLVLFCVKGYDNDGAIPLMAPAVAAHTSILTLQNGIGSGDVLGQAFGVEKVILGATYIDAEKTAPGVVAETGRVREIVFGAETGDRSDKAVAVRDALVSAGVDVDLTETVTSELWAKLIYICALSGMMCITRATFPEILANPGTEQMTWDAMREVEAVAEAKGIVLRPQVVEQTMARFRQVKANGISSMYVDLQRGGPLEVGVLNGAVSRFAKELSVTTPINDFIAACLTIPHDRAVKARG